MTTKPSHTAGSQPTSPLARGNHALRAGKYAEAITKYVEALQRTPALSKTITANLALARQKYRASRTGREHPNVAVCGSELADPAAGRVYTLAKLYEAFAHVEIIGSIFPGFGREIWEPIRNTTHPIHSFFVDDESRFLDQAIELVAAHPYDIVHLSKPRAPNIFFGILYKLIWNANVLIDIDDEELAFVEAETPITVDDYLKSQGKLPELMELNGKDWTRLAVGLAKAFDGITVSNPALQQRYGGEIIRHARDENLYQPSPELKRKSREKFGIPQDKKSVLFFGTPCELNGLLETADAIQSLKWADVIFVIVGDFPDPLLKTKLMAKKGIDYFFIGNQPFDSIPEVVAIGDVCILLHDSNSAVAKFQVPAKLSDALMGGLIVITNYSESISDLAEIEIVLTIDNNNSLLSVLSNLDDKEKNLLNINNIRSKFYKEFSITINSHRIKALNEDIKIKKISSSLINAVAAIGLGEFLSALWPSNGAAKMLSNISDKATYTIDTKFSSIFHKNRSTELDLIANAKLSGEPVRHFKTFDIELDARFVRAVENYKSTFGDTASTAFVSIIMPTYNREKIIERSINSVICQTHKNWELIIVDDGSSDNTIKVLDNYKNETQIRVLKNTHKGVSAARNKGVEAARGEFVFYLDSDNTWTPRHLEIMIFMRLYTGKKLGYSAISLIDEKGMIFGYRGEPFDWDFCLETNYVDLNAFFHDRSLYLELGGFDESLRRMVDWDLILRYTKCNDIFYAPFIGCNYIDSKQDSHRITVMEPLAFKQVVQTKNRLNTSDKMIVSESLKLKFSIKIPAPYEKKSEWGDFHFADSLRESLEKLGHNVVLDFHGEWYDRPSTSEDVVIVMRGLTRYHPRHGQINILWNISHPDQISFEEYESYDIAYIASLSYSVFLNTFLNFEVKPLLQCTDTARFNLEHQNRPVTNKMLFVGNSRNEFRDIVKKAIETGEDIEVYGTLWSQFINQKYIFGDNIPNEELSSYYSSYEAVLNDHWESMRVFGFVSNRIFDVLASGGVLISDPMPSINKIFGDAVYQVKQNEGIEVSLREIRKSVGGYDQKNKIVNFVTANHSFDVRAKSICSDIFNRLGLPTIYDDKSQHVYLGDSSGDFKVGLFLQNGLRPTSSGFIRLISPLTTEFAQAKAKIYLIDKLDDPNLLKCNAIIVQRVAIADMESAERLVELIKANSINLYVDTDDAFSDLPDSHPEKKYYTKLDSILRYLMSVSTHVWFSTTELARLYRANYFSASVLPNCLDPRLWRNYRKPIPLGAFIPKFRILYMGTATHDADFGFVLTALDALEEIRPGSFEVTIIGALKYPPKREWLNVVAPPRGRTLYPKFVRWLVENAQHDIGIAPLVEDLFNSCKSDIKFLDYTALGLATICSNVSAYRTPINRGLVVSAGNTSEQWLKALVLAFENRKLILNLANQSWDYLWGSRSVDFSANIILNQLLFSDQKQPLRIDKTIHQLTPSNKKIAVCVHVYYVHLWSQIVSYLKNIEDDFDMYITCPEQNLKSLELIILADYPLAKIVTCQNKGMDVYPFLYLNYKFDIWRYDAVLKIHTKNDKNEDSMILGRLLLDGVLGSKNLVRFIINELVLGHKIGLVGAECLYRSATCLMYDNMPFIKKIFNLFKIDESKEDWGFIAGTVFWIHGALLRDLASKFTEVSELFDNDQVIKTGIDGTVAHAMERFFGLLPILNRLEFAVTYPGSVSDKSYHLRYVSSGEIKRNPAFRTGSTYHLKRYGNLGSWTELCKKSEYFDESYYVLKAGELIPRFMDPAMHYVLFGDGLDLNPSPNFSGTYYLHKNKDVAKARAVSLVHFLTRGIKEGRSFAKV